MRYSLAEKTNMDVSLYMDESALSHVVQRPHDEHAKS